MEFSKLIAANDWLFCHGQDIDEDFEDCEDDEDFDEAGYFDDEEDELCRRDYYRDDDGDWDGND
jgi:hypothetical protein